jgi:hypothetical protein
MKQVQGNCRAQHVLTLDVQWGLPLPLSLQQAKKKFKKNSKKRGKDIPPDLLSLGRRLKYHLRLNTLKQSRRQSVTGEGGACWWCVQT